MIFFYISSIQSSYMGMLKCFTIHHWLLHHLFPLYTLNTRSGDVSLNFFHEFYPFTRGNIDKRYTKLLG